MIFLMCWNAETPNTPPFRCNACGEECVLKNFFNSFGYKRMSKDGQKSHDDLQKWV